VKVVHHLASQQGIGNMMGKVCCLDVMSFAFNVSGSDAVLFDCWPDLFQDAQ
jgi:hypothetical protein